jgi:hypothetical protein
VLFAAILAGRQAARRENVALVLLTYPASIESYGTVDAVVREAARRTGSPLIDVTPALPPACAVGPCAELFRDGHPTVAGHRRVAKCVAHGLARLRVLDARQ